MAVMLPMCDLTMTEESHAVILHGVLFGILQTVVGSCHGNGSPVKRGHHCFGGGNPGHGYNSWLPMEHGQLINQGALIRPQEGHFHPIGTEQSAGLDGSPLFCFDSIVLLSPQVSGSDKIK